MTYAMSPAGRTEQIANKGRFCEWCARMGPRLEDQKLAQLSSQGVLGEKGQLNKEDEKAKGHGVSHPQ